MDISIITTVYNAERYIVECIESVQKQLLLADIKIEHIIVDDGSNDETKNIVLNLIKDYSNIRYIEAGKIGRARALNLAVNESLGTYIANLDSDDLFLPKKLRKQWDFINKFNKCDLLCTNSITFTESKEFVTVNDETYNEITYTLLKKNNINHSSVLFKKDILLQIGKYDETRNTQIDLELWLRYIHKKKKIYMLNEILAAKRTHPEQNFEKRNRIKYLTNSAVLKISYIKKMNKYKYLPFVVVRFIGGMLPEQIRSLFRKK